jgi:hypothetical protein
LFFGGGPTIFFAIAVQRFGIVKEVGELDHEGDSTGVQFVFEELRGSDKKYIFAVVSWVVGFVLLYVAYPVPRLGRIGAWVILGINAFIIISLSVGKLLS